MLHLLIKSPAGLIIPLCLSLFTVCPITHAEDEKTLSPPLPPAVPVSVSTVQQLALSQSVKMPATVISSDDAQISSEVSGKINSIREVGEQVAEGDILAEIDTSRYQLEYDEARAALLPLESVVVFQRDENKRMKMLMSESHVARSRAQEIDSNYQKTLGEIAMVKARIEVARDRLQRSTIRAAFSGVIAERMGNLGEWVEPGDAILRLVSMQRLEVQVQVPAQTITLLQPGQMLNVWDGNNVEQCMIRVLIPVADPVSRLYELRLQIEHDRWLPGYPLQAELPVNATHTALAIEQDAVVTRRNGTAVYRINTENIAEMIPVSLGVSNQEYIEIIGDIQPGDRLVVRGNERLRPGMPVMIQNLQ